MKNEISKKISEIATNSLMLFFQGSYKKYIEDIYKNVLLAKNENLFKKELLYLGYCQAIDSIRLSKFGSQSVGIEAKKKLEEIFIRDYISAFYEDKNTDELTEEYNSKMDEMLLRDEKCNNDDLRYLLLTIKTFNNRIDVEISGKKTFEFVMLIQLIQSKTIKEINLIS